MATHIDEQESVENFKHFWRSWGKWIFALLIILALGYLGYVLYQSHQTKKDQQAADILASMVEKIRSQSDKKLAQADLINLQQNYSDSIATAQATFMAAATEFDDAHYDIAEGHLKWIIKHQKAPLIQALAIQRLAIVYLQQKKYDDALNVLNTHVEPDFEALTLETKGDTYLAQGKQKEALNAYEQALSKLPKDSNMQELLQLKIDQLK